MSNEKICKQCIYLRVREDEPMHYCFRRKFYIYEGSLGCPDWDDTEVFGSPTGRWQDAVQ